MYIFLGKINVVLTLDVRNEIQMKAIEQYFHVFIMLYKMVLTLKSVDETLVCGNSNRSYS